LCQQPCASLLSVKSRQTFDEDGQGKNGFASDSGYNGIMTSSKAHDESPASIDELATRLIQTIRGYRRVAVAFSGGVDSTVVAKAAHLALGPDAIAVTGNSDSLAHKELDDAVRLARQIGIRHLVIDTAEFGDAAYVRNDGTRCYFCKSELYDRLIALKNELAFDVVCSGANLDDQGDYRPGLTAAAERHIRHPLQEAGLTKRSVRDLARYWKLPNWDKPATPCLSSRLAIGVEVTPERVRRVEEAEAFLAELGFANLRVRYHHGDHARIEVSPDDLPTLVNRAIRERITERFHQLGFKFVSVDLDGFRSGSLNVLVPIGLLAGQAPPSADRP
jgi:uncharacterized protein